MIEVIYCVLIAFGISVLSVNPPLGGGLLIGVALSELFESLGKRVIYFILLVVMLITYASTQSPSYMGLIFALIFAI